MAGISSLVGSEIEVFISARTGQADRTQGVLRESDDHGILLAGGDTEEEIEPYRAFIPWGAITWIKAPGEYEDPDKPHRGMRTIR